MLRCGEVGAFARVFFAWWDWFMEQNKINVSGINIERKPKSGVCTFENVPMTMMWVDTTLAGLMCGLQTMVGSERLLLALQSEGRKSVEEDWKVISSCPDFPSGFKTIANIAAVAGWGNWRLVTLDHSTKTATFEIRDNWEGLYQKALGVCWGSGMVSGKLAGFCTKLFGVNCWATQTSFIALGDEADRFQVSPSSRSIEEEIENLLKSDQGTAADMAVAMKKLRDESEKRKKTMKDLRDSEAYYRNILEMATDGYVVCDNRGKVIQVNKAYCAMTGFSKEELVGKKISELDAIDDEEEVRKRIMEIRDKGVVKFESQHRGKDGRLIDVDISIHTSQMEDEHFFSFVRDITEKKQREKERDALTAQIHHSQKMEALGLLAGGIAHDFNNILAAILGFTEITISSLDSESEEAECMNESLKAINRARELVRQILSFSKKSPEGQNPLKLTEPVSEARRMIRATLPTTISVAFFQDEDIPTIMGNSAQVHQLVVNLCTNAANSVSGTGGCIEIHIKNQVIESDSHNRWPRLKPGNYVLLMVRDNGKGIAPENLNRVFEPFFTTDESGKGTGMGLAVVYGIVKSHGGDVSIINRPEGGVECSVMFPVAGSAAADSEQGHDLSVTKGAGRILFVDDEPQLVKMNRMRLKKLGYSVEALNDPKKALERFLSGKEKYEVLITDQAMPELTGLELAARVREVSPEIPIIICTGYSEEVFESGFFGGKNNYVMSKPIGIHELSELIDQALKDRN